MQTRTIVRLGVVAVVWGCFFSWCLVVMGGDALFEAAKAISWLIRVVSLYLGALAFWIIYNKVLLAVRGPSKLRAGEQRGFDKDYFGRPVAVARGTELRDQHLVLEYADGQKVYRTPAIDRLAGAAEAVVASELKALAAAAGTSISAQRPSSSEAETEAHARDI